MLCILQCQLATTTEKEENSVCTSSNFVSVSIITSMLLFAGSCVIVISQASMATTVFAQEERNNKNTISGTTTAPTIPLTTSGLELSSQPIWNEQATTTSRTPINKTYSIISFLGNGTMTIPDTGKTIIMTNNGTGLVSPVPGYADTISAYEREHVFSEDGDTSAITFYEIIRYDPTTFEGKGLVIAVFDRNATGMLAPFNGMMVIGTHEEAPNAPATIILWQWKIGLLLLPSLPNTKSHVSPMNTTAITDTTN